MCCVSRYFFLCCVFCSDVYFVDGILFTCVCLLYVRVRARVCVRVHLCERVCARARVFVCTSALV
jgi:hypothetical protein